MVFELGILAVLRFDTSDSACTGSILGSNTTLDSACTSTFFGSNTLDTACTRSISGDSTLDTACTSSISGLNTWILLVLEVFWGSMLWNTVCT